MSENTNTTTNNVSAFTDERDTKLWETARKSARLSCTYGIKATAVLARLAASRVLGGEDVSVLATMVADDADMREAGVKASSIRAYGAPLRRLATVLPTSVYEALLIDAGAVTVTTADKWARDPGVTSAKVDRALVGLDVDRTYIAAEMAKLIPSPDAGKGDANKGDANKGDANKGDANKGDANKGDANKGDANKGDANKGDANKGDANKGDANKGTSYGDALEALVDAAQILLNMATRGELTPAERRMMMKNVSKIHAAFDAACSVAADK